MCKYPCPQFNNVIKFKNVKKFTENFQEITLYYQQKTYNEYIYFEENITCLNLIVKYNFPTLQLGYISV